MRLTPNEVRAIEQPTLFIWGDEDFLGAPEAIRGFVESMPDARLESLAAGHIPWLGHPDGCAELILDGRA